VDKLDARVGSAAFWTAAIGYLSQEQAGAERFNGGNAQFFKAVFRHYGPAVLDAMKSPLERICLQATERSSQRAAAEIVAGLLRGMKLWCVHLAHPPSVRQPRPRERYSRTLGAPGGVFLAHRPLEAQNVAAAYLKPLLLGVLDAVTPDTLADWVEALRYATVRGLA